MDASYNNETPGSSMSLRHVKLDFKKKRAPRKSGAQYQAEYRERLKSCPRLWDAYQEEQKRYNKNYLSNLSEEDKKIKNAKKAKRQKESRLSKKQEESLQHVSVSFEPCKKTKTRKQLNDERAYWRDRKRLQRAVMSAGEKAANNEKEGKTLATEISMRIILHFHNIKHRNIITTTPHPGDAMSSGMLNPYCSHYRFLIHNIQHRNISTTTHPRHTTSSGVLYPYCAHYRFPYATFLTLKCYSHHLEMRCRFIHELVVNKDLYLNEEFLAQGSQIDKNLILSKIVALSDSLQNINLKDPNHAALVFKAEVFDTRIIGIHLGPWHLHAASQILSCGIVSLYPKQGPIEYSEALARAFVPLEFKYEEPLFLMWTSNRNDLNKKHWVANHVVPMIKIYK